MAAAEQPPPPMVNTRCPICGGVFRNILAHFLAIHLLYSRTELNTPLGGTFTRLCGECHKPMRHTVLDAHKFLYHGIALSAGAFDRFRFGNGRDELSVRDVFFEFVLSYVPHVDFGSIASVWNMERCGVRYNASTSTFFIKLSDDNGAWPLFQRLPADLNELCEWSADWKEHSSSSSSSSGTTTPSTLHFLVGPSREVVAVLKYFAPPTAAALLLPPPLSTVHSDGVLVADTPPPSPPPLDLDDGDTEEEIISFHSLSL